MRYVDYEWHLDEKKILIDKEINIDKLGYKHGDLFELRNIDGQPQLVKLDPLVKFVKGYD